MSLADEMVLRARADAEQYVASAGSPAAVEALRAEATHLFEALPEPPAYRKSDDPARKRAQELLPKATELLARLLAVTKATPKDARLQPLTRAVEAHLRALAAMAAGEITEGDNLAREAWETARAVTNAGSFFQVENPATRRKVYDPETGESRYDPRPEPTLTVQLFCANTSCKRPAPYSMAPRYATHRFTCPACKQPFTGHFAEVRGHEAKPISRAVHHTLRVQPVGGGDSVLEFDDGSQGDLAVAPRDLIVLLYAKDGALSAVENLTTGRVLWVMPKGPCFLATAAYGEDAPELAAFRAFRDEVLLARPSGRLFVRAYYSVGPFLARPVRASPLLRRAVREVLRPLHRRLARRG